MTASDESAAVTARDRDETQVDIDHTTESLTAPSVDDRADEIEDDARPSIVVDAATKHANDTADGAVISNANPTDEIDASVSPSIADAVTKPAAAVDGNHAGAPAQKEGATPRSNYIPSDFEVVAAGERIEAPAPAVVAAEEGASPMIGSTDGAVDDVAAVEAVLGYTFEDKSLLEAALTHPSFRGAGAGATTYERLEFLGDRAISAAIARHLYRAHPGLGPGPLSRLHDSNVGTEKLARAAVARGLHRFLRHDMRFFALHVGEFEAEAAAYPVHSNGQVAAVRS